MLGLDFVRHGIATSRLPLLAMTIVQSVGFLAMTIVQSVGFLAMTIVQSVGFLAMTIVQDVGSSFVFRDDIQNAR